jgi:hypothetical protein
MEREVVRDAIRQLRATGQPLTARAVHGITKGSMRDIHRLVRAEAEFLDEAEIATLEPDVESVGSVPALEAAVVPMTGACGAIAEAIAAVRLAETAFAEAAAELNGKRQELRELQAAPPLRRTRPQDVDTVGSSGEGGHV